MIKNSNELDNLSTSELTIMLKNLQLGTDNLQQWLNKQQFAELLHLGKLSTQQQENIHADSIEKSGNVAQILNTAITSIFGAWLGFSGFIGLHLNSISILLTVTITASSLGFILGYYSFKTAENEARASINNQKLHNVKLMISRILQDKYRKYMASLIAKLNNRLANLGKTIALPIPPLLNLNNNYDDFIEQMVVIINKKTGSLIKEPSYKSHIKKLIKIKNKLNDLAKKQENKDNNRNNETCLINILKDPNIAKQKIIKKPWLITNVIPNLIGLTPTILGGFSSMFVFLTGGPSIAEQFSAYRLVALLTHPITKVYEFLLAISLTLYFGFSHIYNNKKASQRKNELTRIQNLIANEEVTLTNNKAKIKQLKNLKQYLQKINYLFIIIDDIAKYQQEIVDLKHKINKPQ